jgi:hypothetical protein
MIKAERTKQSKTKSTYGSLYQSKHKEFTNVKNEE